MSGAVIRFLAIKIVVKRDMKIVGETIIPCDKIIIYTLLSNFVTGMMTHGEFSTLCM